MNIYAWLELGNVPNIEEIAVEGGGIWSRTVDEKES